MFLPRSRVLLAYERAEREPDEGVRTLRLNVCVADPQWHDVRVP